MPGKGTREMASPPSACRASEELGTGSTPLLVREKRSGCFLQQVRDAMAAWLRPSSLAVYRARSAAAIRTVGIRTAL